MPFRHILVAHDFHETAESALGLAIELAEKLTSRVTIVHAYEIPVYSFPEGVTLTAEAVGRIHELTTKALEGVVARAQRPGLTVEGMLRQGAAWSEVVAAATKTKADLIVIGTHGRRGLAHALLGSVAEKVVRTAPCPVLTVREPQEGH
jgi:nucleotide-binding universal stress UspA family protein